MAALTGDVFVRARGKMKEYSEADVWRFTVAARAFFIVNGLIFSGVVASLQWG